MSQPATPPEPSGYRAEVMAEMIADPAKVRRELIAEMRAEDPEITDAEIEARMGLVEATLGF